MDRLPVELVIHILNFLSIRRVFLLMRTSRKIEEAVRFVIRRKRNLALGRDLQFCGRRNASCLMSSLDILPWCKREHDEAFIKSLHQMKGLKILRIQDCEDRFDLQPIADSLITKNSQTLEQVCLDFDFSFPAAAKYPKLEKLFCWRLVDDEVIAACPVLTSASCFEMSTRAMEQLNRTSCTILKTGRPAVPALPVISLLSNLTTLHVELDNPFIRSSCSMFETMCQLQEIKLIIHFEGNMDHMIASLCRKNPNLRIIKLCLDQGEIGNDSLSAISTLHHLTKVQLDLKTSNMTTAGLQKLLRGNSRHRLRNLKICIWSASAEAAQSFVDRSLIAHEVLAINREVERKVPLRFG